jgi:hypothetical protein
MRQRSLLEVEVIAVNKSAKSPATQFFDSFEA